MNSAVKEDRWIGQTLGGEYRIKSLLGEGGFGSVYLADQIGVGRTVVVKVIRRALTEEETIVRRFEREARIVASLDHPNIVKVFTAGETDDGAHYVVMEYAEGPTLHEEIHRVGRVDEVRAARIAAQIAGALAAAHTAGVVHRDLKPANVILTSLPGGEDHVRVLDFGIAKLSEQDASAALTASGAILGTPAYMSPEQVGGGEIDGRSDLYTLGVMLYEMVTGKHPYDADTPVQYIIQHLQQPMTPPHIRAPGLALTEAFVDVLDRACAKSPTDRFASAEAMQIALRRTAERLAQATDPATLPVVRPTFGESVRTMAEDPETTPYLAPHPNPSPLRVILPVVLAMLLVVAGAAGAIFYLLVPDEGKPQQPATALVADPVEAPQPATEVVPPQRELGSVPGTANAGTANAGTANAETANAGTANAGTANAGTQPPLQAPTIVPQQIEPAQPKPPASRQPSRAGQPVVQPAPVRNPALSAEDFRFAFDEERGFPLPARSRVRMDTSGMLSTDTPWDLAVIAEFLRAEFDDVSLINDSLDQAEPSFGLMFHDGPLNMVRADPEGTGTRINYFLDPNYEP